MEQDKNIKGLAGRKIQEKKSNQQEKTNSKNTKKNFEIKRAELKEIFNYIKPDLQELADYFCPNSARFIARNANKGRKKSKKIIDSTPLIALRNFSSGMMSGATSPTSRWFRTGVVNKNIEKNHSVKDWCYKQAELTRQILNASNFYQILPEVYKQLGVFSFAAISLESDYEDVVTFKNLPIGSYYFARDNKGKIDTLCRSYMISAKNMVKEFGKENCSQEVIDALEKTPNTLFEIVHFVTVNEEYVKDSPVKYQKKFISVYYEANSEDKFLRKSGFDRFPYVVFEASTNGEDDYPCMGPATHALPDVKQLMTLVKEYAKAAKKIVSPAYKGPASLKNKGFADTPSAYVEEDENGRGISPVYEVNPRVLEIKQVMDELKQTIKEHFYNDLFAMILNTAERGRTATEVNELKEEKMVLLSPLLEQIHNALKQILDWIYYEQIDKGILPEAPEELEGQEIQIEFISTLAQAQKIASISAIERFTTFVSNIAQALDPILLQKVKAEKVIEDYADIINIDPSQLASEDEVAQYREMMNQKQQQQEQIAAMTQGSQMIKNMGGVDAFGSELMQRVGM